MVTSLAQPPTAERPALLPRIARLHLDNLLNHADVPRSIVIGPAGAGKTRTLRRLQEGFAAAGRPAVFAHDIADIAAVDPGHVLLVDDAHLLDPDDLGALGARAASPTAATVIACRPWPLSEGMNDILSAMDTPGLAIVLGQLSATELYEQPGDVAPACVDDLVLLCGGMTWLVAEALAMHSELECEGVAAHGAIALALHEVVAQRLNQVGADARIAVEIESLTPDPDARPTHHDADVVAAAHSLGLLLRNGRTAPVIRSAVRSVTPVGRIIALAESGLIEPSADLLHGVRDVDVARTLLELGDTALHSAPEHALEIYGHAAASGADPAIVAIRRARALWASGRIDEAAVAVDGLDLPPENPDTAFATNVAATVWATRGMPEIADAVYRQSGASAPTVRAGSVIAALAVGDADAVVDDSVRAGHTIPSTVSVAMDTLRRGLRGTLGESAQDALSDLMRASDAYSMAEAAEPVPELPAVLAAIVALNLGELDVAANILDAAEREGQGGTWGRPRLLLWGGWVALQRQRPREVENALAAASISHTIAATPRNRLLEHALTIGLARRYSDTAGVTSEWRKARETTLRAGFDLYGIHPLSEFVVTAARLDDVSWVQRHFDQAITRVEQLGNPIVWSAHLHWAGIQQGILLNRPEALLPHAHALVAAAPTSPVAAAMSHAGRVWTSVLGGNVDADAVEAAAGALADVGLSWDGARLAGYGAGLAEDRHVISRLLACARLLHANEALPGVDGDDAAPMTVAMTGTMLSAREKEVAELVLRGKTYAEIGAAMFISPRTAEHHIARIRRRLGATSRSDLLTKLRLALESSELQERADA